MHPTLSNRKDDALVPGQFWMIGSHQVLLCIRAPLREIFSMAPTFTRKSVERCDAISAPRRQLQLWWWTALTCHCARHTSHCASLPLHAGWAGRQLRGDFSAKETKGSTYHYLSLLLILLLLSRLLNLFPRLHVCRSAALNANAEEAEMPALHVLYVFFYSYSMILL